MVFGPDGEPYYPDKLHVCHIQSWFLDRHPLPRRTGWLVLVHPKLGKVPTCGAVAPPAPRRPAARRDAALQLHSCGHLRDVFVAPPGQVHDDQLVFGQRRSAADDLRHRVR
jgi:hypothetical protein